MATVGKGGSLLRCREEVMLSVLFSSKEKGVGGGAERLLLVGYQAERKLVVVLRGCYWSIIKQKGSC